MLNHNRLYSQEKAIYIREAALALQSISVLADKYKPNGGSESRNCLLLSKRCTSTNRRKPTYVRNVSMHETYQTESAMSYNSVMLKVR
jgi:hypothetical protein